jgi:hypothetical protein
MNTIVVAPKSRLLNWFEGMALVSILQGFPIYANAALILRLAHHDMVRPGRGLILVVVSATFIFAVLASLLGGPRCRKFFKNGHEPLFFDRTLSFADKIAQWRVQPRVSVQLVSTVIMMSLLAVAVLSVGA